MTGYIRIFKEEHQVSIVKIDNERNIDEQVRESIESSYDPQDKFYIEEISDVTDLNLMKHEGRNIL